MADISTALSDDKRKLMIEILSESGASLAAVVIEAAEVETLLLQLGRVRAEMEPPVTPKLEPNPVFRDVTREAVFHVDRQHVVSSEFFLAARHPGPRAIVASFPKEHPMDVSTGAAPQKAAFFLQR